MMFRWSSVERRTTQPLNIIWQPKAVQDLILTIFLEMILFTVAYFSLAGNASFTKITRVFIPGALTINSTGCAVDGGSTSVASRVVWVDQDCSTVPLSGTVLHELFKTKYTVISRV